MVGPSNVTDVLIVRDHLAADMSKRKTRGRDRWRMCKPKSLNHIISS